MIRVIVFLEIVKIEKRNLRCREYGIKYLEDNMC